MKNPLEHLYDATGSAPSLDESSRYFPIPTESLEAANGTPYSVLQRRILPPLPKAGELTGHIVKSEERLDHIANEVSGDGRFFWQLADANPVLHPEELTEFTGRSIGVPSSPNLF